MENVRWFDASLEGREHKITRNYALVMGGLGSTAFSVSEWLTMTPVTAFLIAVPLILAGRWAGTEYRLMYKAICKSMSLCFCHLRLSLSWARYLWALLPDWGIGTRWQLCPKIWLTRISRSFKRLMSTASPADSMSARYPSTPWTSSTW